MIRAPRAMPTVHALDRYREHHPEAEAEDLATAVQAGTPVDPALARTMVGRPVDHARWRGGFETYVLAEDRRGIFVVIPAEDTVVTYLRFERTQVEFALRHWPHGGVTAAPVTAPPPMVGSPYGARPQDPWTTPTTKRQRAAAVSGMPEEDLMLIAKGESRSAWLTAQIAFEELCRRPLRGLAIAPRDVKIRAEFAVSLGDRFRAKLALREAKLGPNDRGRIPCTFVDGTTGHIAALGGGEWALLLDDPPPRRGIRTAEDIREAIRSGPSTSSVGAIIVETRPLSHLAAAIAAHRARLPPHWGLRVYCGPDNAPHLRPICGDDVVEIPGRVASALDYSRLMSSADFWAAVPFENVLVFQQDSRLLRPGIEEFLGWDWVGAPWAAPQEGGNGGLSLRTRSFMLAAIGHEPWDGQENEDRYFCRQAQRLGAALAPRSVCEAFSCETIFRLGTLGCHDIESWLTPDEVERILTQYR